MSSPSFNKIYTRAIKRKGSEKNLLKLMPPVKNKNQLVRIKDDRYLSMMSKCIFQAGFVWRVVENKWPDFETVFFKFDPQKIVLLSPEQLDNIAQDARIIRNRTKVYTVPHNAQFILDKSVTGGSIAKLVANWPSEDLIGLFQLFKKQGSRLGGNTGIRVLRNMGKDTFMPTLEVLRCLQDAGFDITDKFTSKRDQTAVQNVFNEWHQETGLPYSHLSRICACSIGENYI